MARKPAEWAILKPLDLLNFRKKHQISRIKLAGMMGVSSTSVQNWESGTCAPSEENQKKLKKLMEDRLVSDEHGNSVRPCFLLAKSDEVIRTTGFIANVYLRNKPDFPADQVPKLITDIRAALS